MSVKEGFGPPAVNITLGLLFLLDGNLPPRATNLSLPGGTVQELQPHTVDRNTTSETDDAPAFLGQQSCLWVSP